MRRPDPPEPTPAGARLFALGLAAPPWVPDQPAAVHEPPSSALDHGAPAFDHSAQALDHGAPAFDHSAPGPPPLAPMWAQRLPPWVQDLRASPTGAALAGLAVACAACVAITAAVLLRHHAAAVPPPAPALPVSPLAAPSPTGIVVDVGGRVRHPGLVTLPAGARVADALRAAGGPLRSTDLATVNLAARVTDGQLLLIGVPGGGVAGTGPGSSDNPIDLNTATLEQLEALPGVGPVLAQHILDWRQAHNGFRTVDDLQDVPGIGDSKYAALHTLVTV